MQDLGLTYATDTMRLARPGARRSAAWLGKTIGKGRYTLKECIGQGGMGQVYRAWQRNLGRDVAVKLLTGSHAQSTSPERQADCLARFFREARQGAQLSHPHAVTIYDVGQEQQTGFLAMEYLRGQTLHRALDAGPLSAATAVAIGQQVGDALRVAHQQGMLHRDVKPANIMLLAAGHQGQGPFAKLLDFGLVKVFGPAGGALTRSGQRLGSPGYMAPEQALGASLDGRCDVYGLGAVLCEMLLGRPAFGASSVRSLIALQGQSAAPSPLALGWQPEPELSAAAAAAIDNVVQQAMAREAADRFPTMASMLAALARVGVGSPAVAARGEQAERTLMLSGSLNASPSLWPLAAGDQTRLWLSKPRNDGHGDGSRLSERPRPQRGEDTNHSSRPSIGPLVGSHTGGPAQALGAGTARPVLAALVSGAVGLLGVGAGVFLAQAPRWQVDSLPLGARVFHGEQLLCERTPCSVRWHSEDVGRTVHLRFSLPGHDDSVATRVVARRNKQLLVTLQPPEVGGAGLAQPARGQ